MKEEFGGKLTIEWRSFPLRPVPDATVRFKGTYREEAWKRLQALTAGDGIRYEVWSKEEYPTWSLPAAEAAKCAAIQGEIIFERLHLALYEAFFSKGINIALPEEVASLAKEAGCDMDRYQRDIASGQARALVLEDYDIAKSRHAVRAIPTVIINGGAPLVGLHPVEAYRALLLTEPAP